MRRNYDAIDLFKFLASVMIVAIHTDAFLDISPQLNTILCGGIARLGVPYFFIVTAFFYFNKPVDWANTKKYCQRLLTLYLAWFILSIPKTVYDRFICSKVSFGETFFRFVRSFFVTSTFSGSWFLISCVFCAVLYYRLERLDEKNRSAITIALSVLVYFWITFTSAYGRLIETVGLGRFYRVYELLFANPYCSFLVGIPYFAVGRYFSRKREKMTIGGRANWLGFIGSLLLLLLEVYITNTYHLIKSTDCYLMLLPTAAFLFALIMGWEIKLKNAMALRTASTIIYFSQFILIYVCEFIEYWRIIRIPSFGKFLFAIISGLILTWFALAVRGKKRFSLVRYFY